MKKMEVLRTILDTNIKSKEIIENESITIFNIIEKLIFKEDI